MTDQHFDQAVHAWLSDGSDRTPPATIDAVRLAIRATPQEHPLRTRWRAPRPSLVLALGATTLALVMTVGAVVIAPRLGPGTTPGPSASAPGPSGSGPLPPPSRGVVAGFDTAAWRTFSSVAFGYTAALPADWRTDYGTVPNTVDHFLDQGGQSDTFHDAQVERHLAAWSIELPAGVSPDTWKGSYHDNVDPEVACFPPPSSWAAVAVDGRPGSIYPGCNGWWEAMVPVANRVYVFSTFLFHGDGGDPQASASGSSEAFLRAFLSTVALLPEAAIPGSLEAVIFTSPLYGYSVRIPATWLTTPASESWLAGVRIGREKADVDTFRPGGSRWLQAYVAARAVEPGTTLDEWIASWGGTREELGGSCSYQTNGWEASADSETEALSVAGATTKHRPMRCNPGQFGVEAWDQYAFIANGNGYAIAGTTSMVEELASGFQPK